MSTACSGSLVWAQMPSGVGETRIPISPSFTATISRCSSRTPVSSTSPPAIPQAMRNVPASMRSPMISVSAAVRASTPSTVMVLVPAPITCAPMRFRNAVRSVISGSRAAFSITVSPFASTAAVSRFSVAPTLGNSSTMRAPHSALQRARMNPCSTAISAPIASSPRTCMSSRRLPMLSPPGSATLASPQRATRGPSTLIDARILRTSSYGASGWSGPLVSIVSSSAPVQVTSAPTARRTSSMTSRSRTRERLRTWVTPDASSAAASCFNPEFFVAPETRMVPDNGPPGRTRTASIRSGYRSVRRG